MPTVLISSGPLRGQPGFFRNRLLEAGFELLDPPGDHMLGPAEVLEWLPRCEAIIAGGETIGAAQLEAAPRLRVIARTGVGFDAVDIPAATARRVAVTITPGTNEESVAEQTFALLLAVTRRISVNDRLIHNGGWDRTLVQPVRGKVLGLIGFGRIGRAMVPRALAFGLRILATDPNADHAFAAAHNVGLVDLETLLADSDIVSLHAPATPQTRHLINTATLARMKPGAILINTARGSLVDQEALANSLRSGHLSGAGLDVLEPEPPGPGHPLLGLPQVVISPHVGGIDTLAMAAMAELAAQSILDLHLGRPLRPGQLVNPEIGPEWTW